MAGGDVIGVDPIGVVEQPTEFDPMIAFHARIRGPAVEVIIDKIVDDPPKVPLQVEGVKRDIQFGSHPPGVGGVGGATTALLVLGAGTENGQAAARIRWYLAGLARFLAMPHEDPDHLMPGLEQQVCRDARIDAAAHREYDTCHDSPIAIRNVGVNLKRERTRSHGSYLHIIRLESTKSWMPTCLIAAN